MQTSKLSFNQQNLKFANSILLKLPALGLRLFLATTAIHSCHNTPRNELLVQPSPEVQGQERSVPKSEPLGIRQRVPAVHQMVFYHLLALLALLAVFQYHASNMHLKLQG